MFSLLFVLLNLEIIYFSKKNYLKKKFSFTTLEFKKKNDKRNILNGQNFWNEYLFS